MERLPKENLTAKIIAIIMAIVLWVYVMNEQNPAVESSLEVALEVRNLASSAMVNDLPEKVRLKVRGPRAVIVALNPKDLKAAVDLKDLPEGRNAVKVTASVPNGIELLEVAPDRVNIVIDTLATRQMPIEVKVNGQPQNGRIVGKIVPSLERAMVEGPNQLMASAAKLVAVVDVEGKPNDFTVMTPLMILDDKGKKVEGLTVHPSSISLAVPISTAISKKTVDVKPNVTGMLPKDYILSQVIITPAQVEISGDPKILEKEDMVFTEPVNLIGIEKQTTLETRLQLKDGLVSNRKTVNVTISVEKKP